MLIFYVFYRFSFDDMIRYVSLSEGNIVNLMAVKTKVKSELNAKTKLALIVAALILVAAITATVLVCANRADTRSEFFSMLGSVAKGIDVSEHNGEIDWNTVSDNVDFAFVRAGYRGYGTGKIAEDKYAKQNLKQANKADVPVGVYFYTQAVNAEEAKKEAQFVLSIIGRYDIDLPIVIDFEFAADSEGYDTGRLYEANLSAQQSTEIINAFCSEISAKGYTPALYASSGMMLYHIDMEQLNSDAVIWVADYNKEPIYSGDYDIWQYSKTESCDGISSKYVDMNYWYL